MALHLDASGRRSLSFWAKRVDELYDTAVERTLARHGLARRHWDVLNRVASGPTTLTQLAQVLGPSWSARGATLRATLSELERRDWIESSVENGYSLTTWGAGAHLRVARHLSATHERAAEGLADEDCASAVHVLRQMSENLVRALTMIQN